MALRYGKIKKQMRRTLAPADPDRYAVVEAPEERFYFRFKLVLAGLVVFFGVLLLPIAEGVYDRGRDIDIARLKRYEKLLPDRHVVLAYVNYLKGRL